MSFESDLQAGLATLREYSVSRMSTRGVITRPGDLVDPVTGEAESVQIYPDPGWPEGHPHADGKMRVHSDRPHESESLAAQSVVRIKQRQLLSIPVGAVQVQEGDLVEIVASPGSEYLVGHRYRIGGPDDRTDQTAHRVFIDRQV